MLALGRFVCHTQKTSNMLDSFPLTKRNLNASRGNSFHFQHEKNKKLFVYILIVFYYSYLSTSNGEREKGIGNKCKEETRTNAMQFHQVVFHRTYGNQLEIAFHLWMTQAMFHILFPLTHKLREK